MAITTAKNNRGKAALYLAALLGFFISNQLIAQEWHFTPYVEVKGDFSDNIRLTENDRSASYVGQLNPGVKLHEVGKRTQFNLNYLMQNITYSNTEFRDKTYHQGDGYLNYELIDDVLTFYNNGSVTQDSKDIHRSSSYDNVSNPDNITSILRLNSGLRWEQSIHNRSDILLDISGSYTNKKDSRDDDKGWDILFNNSSTHQVRSGYWQLYYTGSKRIPKDEEQSLLQEGRIEAGPQIAPHLVLYATFFKEKNDIPDSVSEEYLNSSSAGGGLRWQPNQRTTLAAAYNVSLDGDNPDYWSMNFNLTPNPRVMLSGAYGYRFYGRSYQFAFSYLRPKTQMSLSYTEGLTSYSRNVSQSPAATSSEAMPDEAAPEEDGQSTAAAPGNSSSTSTYLSRNASWITSHQRGRHELQMEFFYTERDYITITDEERDFGGKFNWKLILGPRTDISFNTLYRNLRTDESPQSIDDEALKYGKEWLSSINFSRQLSRRGTLALQLEHRDKQGITSNVENYIENRIGLYYTFIIADRYRTR